MFYRRTPHVAELQMGIPASRLEDACAIDHFDVSRLPFITLLGMCTLRERVIDVENFNEHSC